MVMALSKKANVYLLDEPFKGLDDEARRRVVKLIEEKAKEAAVYFATNEWESINVIGPTIWIEKGELYEESGSYRPGVSDIDE